MDYDNRRSASDYDGSKTLTKQREPLEMKADADKGLFTGYASKFWVVDSYGEVTAPGAFLKSIAERGPAGADRIPVRYEHYQTIGKHTAMSEDDDGLLIEGFISDDGQFGTVVRRHLADGIAYGLSIGFRNIASRPATVDDPLDFSSAPQWVRGLQPEDIRVLTEIRLMENSVVTFPAVDPATVETYRATTEPISVTAFMAAIAAGKLTDEDIEAIRAALPAVDGMPDAQGVAGTVDTEAKRKRYREASILLARAGVYQ
jgi:HK97 family phage prohead protease